jgi:hypothetical protein
MIIDLSRDIDRQLGRVSWEIVQVYQHVMVDRRTAPCSRKATV